MFENKCASPPYLQSKSSTLCPGVLKDVVKQKARMGVGSLCSSWLQVMERTEDLSKMGVSLVHTDSLLPSLLDSKFTFLMRPPWMPSFKLSPRTSDPPYSIFGFNSYCYVYIL